MRISSGSNRSWPRACAAAVAASLLAASCAGIFATRIGDIQGSPGRFDGRHVTVVGDVSRTVNLLFVKYFVVRDSSGEIAVVTQRPLPKEGDHVSVKGTVHQAFKLGDANLVVIVEENPPR